MYSSELKEQIERDKSLALKMKNTIVDATNYYNQLKWIGDEDYFGGDFERQVKMTTYALNMTIQIIGETVIKFSDDYEDSYLQGVNALKLYKSRNIISHAYEAVDMNIIGAIVEKYLPDIEYGIEMFRIDLQNKVPYSRKDKK